MSKKTTHQIRTNVRAGLLHISGTLGGVPYGVTVNLTDGTAAWDSNIPWHTAPATLPVDADSDEGCAGCGSLLSKLIKGGMGWAKALLKVDQVSPDVAAARKALCLLCPSKCYDFGICRDDLPNKTAYQQGCGCVLALKVTQASEECPHRHWGRVDGKS